MDFVGEEYYKLNRILLLWLGLWPYESTVLKKIQMIFFQTLFISFLICQLSTFLVRKYSVDLFIRITTCSIINIIYIVKYNACLILNNNMRSIFDRVRYDWNILKSQAEIEIIRRYANNARSHTIFFVSFITAVLLGNAILTCVLDAISPRNRSRPRRLLMIAEHVIDKEKYFYTVLIHTLLTTYLGCITLAAILTMLISYVWHTCAMFKIACYRIEQMLDKSVLQVPKGIRQRVFYDKLICAVYIHRRAMDLANIMTNSFATLYFILLVLGVASTSLTVLYFLNAVTSPDNEWDVLISAAIIIIHLYYIFMANYVGQSIIDKSTNVCRVSYNTRWYAAPLWMQKTLLLIMKRSSKSSSLIAGGLFQASFEGFATLMSMSLSYVMVIHSMRAQQKRTLEDV